MSRKLGFSSNLIATLAGSLGAWDPLDPTRILPLSRVGAISQIPVNVEG